MIAQDKELDPQVNQHDKKQLSDKSREENQNSNSDPHLSIIEEEKSQSSQNSSYFGLSSAKDVGSAKKLKKESDCLEFIQLEAFNSILRAD